MPTDVAVCSGLRNNHPAGPLRTVFPVADEPASQLFAGRLNFAVAIGCSRNQNVLSRTRILPVERPEQPGELAMAVVNQGWSPWTGVELHFHFVDSSPRAP